MPVQDNRSWFDKLIWQEDRMLLDNLVFRLQHYKSDDWDLGENCFIFFKIKFLVDQYAEFWALRPDFDPQNVVELGMWDGGSVVFWFEYFQPNKHIGIDIQPKKDSSYFHQYINSRGVADRINTYWNTDQTDAQKLRKIIKREFSGPLDLVIDDASHMYEQTKISFETLFPLLRPGGLYIIEDWAWAYWQEFRAPDHPWANRTPLSKLVFELIEAAGASRADHNSSAVANITVFQGFTVVERSDVEVAEPERFRLEYLTLEPTETSPALSGQPGPGQETQLADLKQQLTRQNVYIKELEQRLRAMENTRAWRWASKWYAFKQFLKQSTDSL